MSFKPGINQLQWLVWVFVLLAVMLSLLPMDGFAQAFVYALLNTLFYVAIVYGNILLLFPRLYQKSKYGWYVLSVIVFLAAVGVIRGFITMYAYNLWFAMHPEPMTTKAIASFIIGGIMVFLLSFVFRIAIEYFKLKQRSDEIMAQRTQAELNLLKSQVQPHFLFNTLNNIYYEAYLESPRTASLIERLSDIMRYFVDEAPKQLVPLATELQFLENYIALEKIRIRHSIQLEFTKDFDQGISLPPMLLMTFVENVFKHGIDKTSTNNKVAIKLVQEGNRLVFLAENLVLAGAGVHQSAGFGIVNLRKRLVLLYGDDLILAVQNNGTVYRASLNIPLA